MVTIGQLLTAIKRYKPRSAWDNGVKLSAIDIIEYLEPDPRYQIDNINQFEKILLDGNRNWREYSANGLPLSFEQDIARRFCNPSELKKVQKKTKDVWGAWEYRRPNSDENWFDLQGRASYQAFELIKRTYLALKG